MNKVLGLCAAALFAANANAVVIDSAVATVNSKPILQSDYDKTVDAYIGQYEAQAPQVLAQPGAKLQLEREILNQMIADEVLYQSAVNAGTKVRDEEVNQQVERAKDAVAPEIDPETKKKRTAKERKKIFADNLKKEGLSETQFKDMIKKQLTAKKFYESDILGKIKPVEDEEVQKLFDDVKAHLDKDTKKLTLWTARLEERKQKLLLKSLRS
ncbi:hypothetical protein Dip510_000323 [Elusimicrobium posterum]|uniref:SurA N-terminal domain-containing protein n=1 Tax=Elusimicrobium posterum TaxID=3116653 RepID=UPI003C77EC3A